MSGLRSQKGLPASELASELRCAFSGIVAGNVKSEGIELVEKYGPYIINGEKELMQDMEELLASFIAQKRMKIDVENYEPCWRLG